MTDEECLAALKAQRDAVDQEIEWLRLLQYLVIPTIIGPFLVGWEIKKLYARGNELRTQWYDLDRKIRDERHERRMAYLARPLACRVGFGDPCPRRACDYCKEM